MRAIELRNLLSRDLLFVALAKSEDQDRHERAEQTQSRQPPDVPDQRKADDDGKERGGYSDGAVLSPVPPTTPG
jgi:hypothetical protein